MNLKRHREQPSLTHVVTTCFGLMYLVMFVTTWLSFKTKPGIDHTVLFWAGYAVIGLMQAWIAVFLLRELFRQAMLYRRCKSS